VDRRDQRELTGQPLRERLLVLGGRDPGLPLALAVVLGGQLLDARAKDLGEQRRVLDQERPQRERGLRARHHRATSQVVPSFESFSAIPAAASSSRMRSASAKSFIWRATSRAAIRFSTSEDGIDG